MLPVSFLPEGTRETGATIGLWGIPTRHRTPLFFKRLKYSVQGRLSPNAIVQRITSSAAFSEVNSSGLEITLEAPNSFEETQYIVLKISIVFLNIPCIPSPCRDS